MIFIINWLIASFLNGLVFFSIFLFLLYWFYLKELPVKTPEPQPQFEPFSLNAALKEMIYSNKHSDAQNSDPDCIISLNMMFQFLFQELKDTKAVRRYIIRKMSMEFKELLNSKAAGKIIQKISARDFSLGNSFPVIHSIKMQSYQMDKDKKSLQELSVVIDLEYKNGFSISIDADLILGRSAYVHVKIASVKGKARVQFSRSPFTHWNFAFIEEPEIEFAATSQFDGRQIPQLTTLILNQLRRSIRRKHTLPNYKCRFKPFFEPLNDQSLYKSHIDELFLKKSTSSTTNPSEAINSASNSLSRSNSVQNVISDNTLLNSNVSNKTNNDNVGSLINKPGITSIQYRKFCEKLGYDLTSIGQLVVCLKFCDRLPESLYSLNFPQLSNQTQQPILISPVNGGPVTQMPKSASSTQLPSLQTQDAPACKIFFTVSVDSVSMKNLMNKQICKEHWPLIEFELIRTNMNQSLGLSYVETFFINKTEVVIQKIFPNSLAAVSIGSNSTTLSSYDIIHSLNQVRVTSIKQLNKIIQKAGINSKLKFIIQRPCIILNKTIPTSSTFLKKQDFTESLTIDTTISTPSQKINQENLLTPNDQGSSLLLNTQTNSLINSIPSNITNSTSSSIVSNTRQKLGRLEQKLKNSFGTINSSSIGSKESNDNELQSNSQNLLSTTPNNESSRDLLIGNNLTPMQQASPIIPILTNTASSSFLVDYFCSVSECLVGEKLPTLDIISLLVNSELNQSFTDENSNNKQANTDEDEFNSTKRNQFYFRKTQEIKLEREHLFSFNNQPIQIDETFSFDLNKKSSFLNVFMWTIQYTNKMTKIKNLLIGYITIPLNEITVDCWNTSKGETQSTIYFNPIEEMKASAISKLTKSHVLSDHPGFDSNISIGSLTVNFLHKLNTNRDENQEINLASKVANELIEQKDLEIELNKQIVSSNLIGNEVDDGSIHKFLNVQFNDTVICEFCNKKIWFKNAYRCAYCGFIIHLKCYEKTIGKTICGRFFSKINKDNFDEISINPNTKQPPSTDTIENYVIVSEDQINPPNNAISNRKSYPMSSENKVTLKRSISPSQISLLSTASENSLTSSRKLVSNFISGIRHRHNNKNQEQQPQTSTFSLSSLKSNSFLNSFNIINKNKLNPSPIPSLNEDNLSEVNLDKKLDTDDDLGQDFDDFKDVDPSEEKLFGTELFDELPLEERKTKFEETIQKYQSTIEMMTKIKEELEKELEIEVKSKLSKSKSKQIKNVLTSASLSGASFPSQQEHQIKSQIKHLDEQIKCVAFLLMQCQIGLENCNDILVNKEVPLTSTLATTPKDTVSQIEIPKICVNQIEIDGIKK